MLNFITFFIDEVKYKVLLFFYTKYSLIGGLQEGKTDRRMNGGEKRGNEDIFIKKNLLKSHI